ncbi:MAG: DUF4911 domain-containing protein [Deltaproteobacteria bacterium]|nr:MAG: DUF4911 domain-containing protein [Deltaproteobacteria bacterium]
MGVLVDMQTVRKILCVDRREIHYLRTTLESYDGMAVVRTIDPSEARIEIMISPGCEWLVSELLASMEKNEGIVLRIPENFSGNRA